MISAISATSSLGTNGQAAMSFITKGSVNSASSAFVSVSFWRNSSKPIVLPERGPVRALIRPQRRRLRAPCALGTVSSTASSGQSDEAQYDDDDATMGEQGLVYGMTMPDLTEADKDYLDQASSNDDFMKRMTEIACRIDRERRIALRKANRQDAEKYLRSLSRRVAPTGDGGPPRVNAGDAYIEKLAMKGRESSGIENPPLPANGRSSISEPEPVENVSDTEHLETLERVEDRISKLQDELETVGTDINPNATFEDVVDLQKAIRQDMGLEDAQPTKKPEPKTIDKQIGFLEGYLEKLKQEEREESDSGVDDSSEELSDLDSVDDTLEYTVRQMEEKFTPEFKGLDDTPGGMTAAEKMAAFDEIRRQAMKSTPQEPNLFDPYNVTLPASKNENGEEPSPDSEQEYDQLGGDVDKNLLVEEVEAEIARYTREAKKLLLKHDARMQVLLARLRAL